MYRSVQTRARAGLSAASVVAVLSCATLCACGQANQGQASEPIDSSSGGSSQGAAGAGGTFSTGGTFAGVVSPGGTFSTGGTFAGVAGGAFSTGGEPAAGGASDLYGLHCSSLEAGELVTPEGDYGLVGTYNGRPFTLAPDQLGFGYYCPGALHLSFSLAGEVLAFVIKDCSSYAIMPDGVGLTLTTDGEVGIRMNAEAQSPYWGTATGHLRLHADETPTNPVVDAEIRYSLPMIEPPVARPCPG